MIKFSLTEVERLIWLRTNPSQASKPIEYWLDQSADKPFHTINCNDCRVGSVILSVLKLSRYPCVFTYQCWKSLYFSQPHKQRWYYGGKSKLLFCFF